MSGLTGLSVSQVVHLLLTFKVYSGHGPVFGGGLFSELTEVETGVM